MKIHEIGPVGEVIARNFLVSKGFLILDRNYSINGIGEIDIIAIKSHVLHFIEVKTSQNTDIYSDFHTVTHFDRKKKERLIRMMELCSKKRQITNKCRVCDLIVVSLDSNTMKASVHFEENIYMSTI